MQVSPWVRPERQAPCRPLNLSKSWLRWPSESAQKKRMEKPRPKSSFNLTGRVKMPKKRKPKKPEERLQIVVSAIRPAADYERVRILKAAAVMLGIKSFQHNRDCE